MLSYPRLLVVAEPGSALSLRREPRRGRRAAAPGEQRQRGVRGSETPQLDHALVHHGTPRAHRIAALDGPPGERQPLRLARGFAGRRADSARSPRQARRPRRRVHARRPVSRRRRRARRSSDAGRARGRARDQHREVQRDPGRARARGVRRHGDRAQGRAAHQRTPGKPQHPSVRRGDRQHQAAPRDRRRRRALQSRRDDRPARPRRISTIFARAASTPQRRARS